MSDVTIPLSGKQVVLTVVGKNDELQTTEFPTDVTIVWENQSETLCLLQEYESGNKFKRKVLPVSPATEGNATIRCKAIFDNPLGEDQITLTKDFVIQIKNMNPTSIDIEHTVEDQ